MQIGRQSQALLRHCLALSEARGPAQLTDLRHVSQSGILQLSHLGQAPCSGQDMQLRALSAAASAAPGPEEVSRGEDLVVQARKNTQFWLRSSIIGLAIRHLSTIELQS